MGARASGSNLRTLVQLRGNTSFIQFLQVHRVQNCLMKLLRSLHKDRHHTITHYRHLLITSIEQAEREKAITLEHLIDIDHMVNQSLQMLQRLVLVSKSVSLLNTL